MKALRQIILLLIVFSWLTDAECAGFTQKRKLKLDFAPESQEVTDDINRLIEKGYKYLAKKSLDISGARECIDSVHLICVKEGISTPSSYHLLSAEYYFRSGDFRRSSSEAETAMSIADKSADYEALAKATVFMGRYYFRTSFYQESIDYLDKSLIIADKYDIKGIKPRAYEAKANIYNALKDLDKRMQSLRNLIESATTEKDTVGAMFGYYQLGTLITGENANVPWRDFKTADSLLKKCYFLSIIYPDTVNAASCLANMGWNYYLARMYDPAISHYKKALTYSLPAGIHAASANSYGNLGTIYRDLGDTERSIFFYGLSVDQAKKANDWYSLSWVYKDMSDMYLGMKDTAKAFNTFVLHKQFSDSLNSSRSNLGLTDARLRYDTDTHRKEVQLLSLRVRNQRLILFGFIGFIVLGLFIGWLLFRASQLKSKRRLSELNRKMAEIRQANLRQQMNPHFIFNTLNSIQYYMYQHDKLATNNYLTKFSNLMRKVLDNSQHDSVPLRDELNALKLYLELESIRFKDKFDFEINVDEEIDTMLYKVPTMLIQPYVENSICHGLMPLEGRGSVKIDIRLNEDHLLCRIEDNGIGRAAAQERKTNIGSNHNSLGTRIAVTRLDLVNELYGTSLKTSYTDLQDVNGDPSGTLVEIHIPILT